MDTSTLNQIIKYFKYVLAISVTLWAIIMGSFSSVIVQHSEYENKWHNWINPITILKFSKDQMLLNQDKFVQNIDLQGNVKNIGEKLSDEDISIYYIVDVTPSIKSSQELNTYFIEKFNNKDNGEDNRYKKLIDVCNKKCSSIALHTAIAFESKKDYELLIYKGESKKVNWSNLDNIVVDPTQDHGHKNIGNKDKINWKTQNAVKELKRIPKNVETDLGELFKSAFEAINDKNKNVVNIISDFKHDKSIEKAMQQIETAINNIGDKLYQLNLFVLSDYNGKYVSSTEILDGLENILKAINIYYYPHIFNGTFNLEEMNLRSYSSLTIPNPQIISFYRPYMLKNNNNNYKCKLEIKNNQNEFFVTLRGLSEKKEGEKPLVTLSDDGKTKIMRINKIQKISSEILNMNFHNNSYNDLDCVFLELNSKLSNYTLRYPIIFKDKMPKTATFLFVLFLFASIFCLINLVAIFILSFLSNYNIAWIIGILLSFTILILVYFIPIWEQLLAIILSLIIISLVPVLTIKRGKH